MREGLEGRRNVLVLGKRDAKASDVMGTTECDSSVGVTGAEVARETPRAVDGTIGRGNVGAGKGGNLAVLGVWCLERALCNRL